MLLWAMLLLGGSLLATRAAGTCHSGADESGTYVTCDSGPTSFTLTRVADNYLMLRCKRGTYSCSVIPDAYSHFTRLVDLPDAKVTLSYFEVLDCTLGEPLACILGAVNAEDVRNLIFWNTRGKLLSDHIQGLKSVVTVTMKSVVTDENLTSAHHEALSHLSALSRVTISGGKLKRLPAGGFSNAPRAYSLSLPDNQIEDIDDDAFEGLIQLGYLNLNNNSISFLPRRLFQYCPALRLLSLRNNKLQVIESGVFSNQKELRDLDLSENSIKTIQNGLFSSQRYLDKLNLSNNELVHLESTCFDGLSALTEIYLSGNHLTNLEPVTFDALLDLKVLIASDNELQMFNDTSPFSNLQQLSTLELQYNRLSHVCNDWRLLPKLLHLNLSHNQITRLSSRDMNWINQAEVDFSHNKIENIEPHVYPVGFRIFSLHNNPYSCDCSLYPFLKAIKENKSIGHFDKNDLVCSTPPDLAGMLFTELTEGVLKCLTCSSNCSCEIRMSISTAVYELTCSSLPRSFPATDLPIQVTLTNKTQRIRKLPANVKYLIMSNLNMTKSPHINASLEVDLRYNRLTKAPLQLFEANCSLKLANNPFICDCYSQKTFKALKRYEKQISDFSKVTCNGGLVINSHNIKDLCVFQNAVILGYTLSASLIIFIACTLIIYTKKTLISSCMKKYGIWFAKQNNKNKRYDAFVSFADEDEEYVYQQLLPNMEQGTSPLKLCVPCRDWEVGGLISEQISRSVQESHVTIVVLSRHFGKSTWRQMEFRTAKALQGVVVLIMDDVLKRYSEQELRTYTNMNTCVKASDPFVWDKMKRAVLKRSKLLTSE